MSDLDHIDRTRSASTYATVLQAELVRLCAMLDAYTGASGLALLRTRCTASQNLLDALTTRLNTPSAATLTEPDHQTLDTARDLRDRLSESLARYQRAGANAPIPIA